MHTVYPGVKFYPIYAEQECFALKNPTLKQHVTQCTIVWHGCRRESGAQIDPLSNILEPIELNRGYAGSTYFVGSEWVLNGQNGNSELRANYCSRMPMHA